MPSSAFGVISDQLFSCHSCHLLLSGLCSWRVRRSRARGRGGLARGAGVFKQGQGAGADGHGLKLKRSLHFCPALPYRPDSSRVTRDSRRRATQPSQRTFCSHSDCRRSGTRRRYPTTREALGFGLPGARVSVTPSPWGAGGYEHGLFFSCGGRGLSFQCD